MQAEARWCFVAVVDKLDLVGSQLGAGEARDGDARGTDQLEDATSQATHAVGKGGAVHVGDADVGRRERDRLPFAHRQGDGG